MKAKNGRISSLKELKGPAAIFNATLMLIDGSPLRVEYVSYISLSWPEQAAGWPRRHREYDRPKPKTVELIANKLRCCLASAVHHRCEHNVEFGENQCRLSFLRAEFVLLNS